MRRISFFSSLIFTLALGACLPTWPTVSAAEPAKKPTAPKPPTHTVERGPIKIDVSFNGFFEAQEMAEISLTPEEWSSFTILDAVEHGALVKRGDVLVTLDTEKIDRAIEDLRLDNEMSALALTLDEKELALREKSVALDLAAGARTEKEVDEDLDYYFKTSRDLTLRSADFSLKNTTDNVEYTREELEQLEKMYAADDLTEETEELILRRARNSLEQAEFSLERAQVSRDRTVDVLVPRQDADLKESAESFSLMWEDAKATLPLELERARLALDKQKTRLDQSRKRLEELLADRELMKIVAPASGVVYYGRCSNGKFSGGSDDSFRPGESLPTKRVFMTIVKPRPMFIRAEVAERDLHAVRGGLKGKAEPTGYPDMKLAVIVDRVASIPTSSAKYDARITVALDEEAEPLMPGMGCKVTLVSYEKKDALTVPSRCVLSEDDDDDAQFVYLVDDQGEAKKQPVTVGKRTSSKVEILEGLDEGDQVLLSPPKDNGSSDKKLTDDGDKPDDAAQDSDETDQPDSREGDSTKSKSTSDENDNPADREGDNEDRENEGGTDPESPEPTLAMVF